MKVIFLDIDGVLITKASMMTRRANVPSAYCVNNLNHITAMTEARIVVSSSWRFIGVDNLKLKFRDWGITGRIYDVTPDLSEERNGVAVAKSRSDEITAWLLAVEGPVTSIVILDDDDVDDVLRAFLVRTDFDNGLTEWDAKRAIEILGKWEHTAG